MTTLHNIAGLGSRVGLRQVPWRRVAADAGLLAGFLLVSSWLLVR